MSTPMQPGPGMTPQPAEVKRRSPWKIVLIVAIGLLVVCGGGAVACTAILAKAGSDAVDELDKELNAEKTDITVTGCEANNSDIITTVTVSWEVKNSGKNKRTYMPKFAVDSEDGTRLGEGADIVSDLAAGQTSKKTTPIILDKKVTGKITCSLTN